MKNSGNIRLIDNYPLPVLERRKHLLTPTISPDSSHYAGWLDEDRDVLVSSSVSSLSWGPLTVKQKSIIYSFPLIVLIVLYWGDADTGGGDAGGTNTLSGTSPFSHPRRLLMVIISSWELWQSVLPCVKVMLCESSLPPPHHVRWSDGRPPSSGKFYGFQIRNKLNWTELLYITVRSVGRQEHHGWFWRRST